MQHFDIAIIALDFQNKGGYTHEHVGDLGTSYCIFLRVKRKGTKFRVLVDMSTKVSYISTSLVWRHQSRDQT